MFYSICIFWSCLFACSRGGCFSLLVLVAKQLFQWEPGDADLHVLTRTRDWSSFVNERIERACYQSRGRVFWCSCQKTVNFQVKHKAISQKQKQKQKHTKKTSAASPVVHRKWTTGDHLVTTGRQQLILLPFYVWINWISYAASVSSEWDPWYFLGGLSVFWHKLPSKSHNSSALVSLNKRTRRACEPAS